LYGVSGDVWAALAVAVTVADQGRQYTELEASIGGATDLDDFGTSSLPF